MGRKTNSNCSANARKITFKRRYFEMYNGKVAKWMIPDDVIFTDNIPLGATGKILKNKLRDQFGGHKISSNI